MRSIVEIMADPAIYGRQVDAVTVVETHISWVFIAGDRAYKVKKPVTLPFLDYSTLERRRRFCFEEVRLNRRLAPDLYLGVHALVERAYGTFALADGDDPGAIEYVVEMRPVPADRTVAALVAAEALDSEHVTAIARRLADFHLTAVRVAAEGAASFRLQLDRAVARIGDDHLARALGSLCDACAPELDQRARNGRVRDCHGDLRAEHVIVGDSILIFDCIEFDPALRQIDVGADLAFLLMDLERLGRPEAAGRLLGAYRAAGGYPGSDRLIALFCAYRACVRAGVAMIRAQQLAGPERQEASAQVEHLIRLAWHFVWRGHMPLVLAVCGPAAVGKTHLALELAEVSGLAYFGSDRARRELAHAGATAPLRPAFYRHEINEQVYEKLGSEAAAAVADGGAIVDATFRYRDDRDSFRSALGTVEPVFVECEAPPPVIEARAQRRLADPHRTSDAGPALALAQLAEFEPLAEVDREHQLHVRTDQAVELSATDVEAALAGCRDSAARNGEQRLTHA